MKCSAKNPRPLPNRTISERIEYCKKNIWSRYKENGLFYCGAALSLSYLWCEFETFFDKDFFEELETILNPLTQINYAQKLFSSGDISISEI